MHNTLGVLPCSTKHGQVSAWPLLLAHTVAAAAAAATLANGVGMRLQAA
jgi:hypothetical protein